MSIWPAGRDSNERSVGVVVDPVDGHRDRSVELLRAQRCRAGHHIGRPTLNHQAQVKVVQDGRVERVTPYVAPSWSTLTERSPPSRNGFVRGGTHPHEVSGPIGEVAGRRVRAGLGEDDQGAGQLAAHAGDDPSTVDELGDDFLVGMPDTGLLPLESWRRLVVRELHGSIIHSGQYGDPFGHAGLRPATTAAF